jgi:SAM-dependent methyltransferase
LNEGLRADRGGGNLSRVTTPKDTAERPGTYAFDQEWQEERRRLAGMEELWDPGTRSVIEALGIAPGWRCLEVGAGSGSVAAWLAERAGVEGEVLATDVNTRHLVAVAGPALEVRRHDILTDPLPREHFDLVHARLVVEHIGGDVALRRLLPPLRPGGWLVVESFDGASPVMDPFDETTERAIEAMLGMLSRSGYDRDYGRKLIRALEGAGLAEVRAEGRVRVFRGGSPGVEMLRLSIESLAPALVESGQLAHDDVEAALARLADPDTVFVSPPMIAAWGMRPPAA